MNIPMHVQSIKYVIEFHRASYYCRLASDQLKQNYPKAIDRHFLGEDSICLKFVCKKKKKEKKSD